MLPAAPPDLHDKKRVYRRNQVQEYLVWCTLEGQLDWFALEAEEYRAIVPDEAGIIQSRVFPGLWLAADALLAGDLPKFLSTLQAELAIAAHQAFVQRLSALST
nr:Uma2 family endonuclease [Thermoleptolyngbya sichuanensis]